MRHCLFQDRSQPPCASTQCPALPFPFSLPFLFPRKKCHEQYSPFLRVSNLPSPLQHAHRITSAHRHCWPGHLGFCESCYVTASQVGEVQYLLIDAPCRVRCHFNRLAVVIGAGRRFHPIIYTLTAARGAEGHARGFFDIGRSSSWREGVGAITLLQASVVLVIQYITFP
jgi:hypothetical protein